MPFGPFLRRVNRLTAMFRNATSHPAHYRCIDRNARYDDLSFCQRGQFVQHLPADAFDTAGNGLLINWIDDTHYELGHALRQDILIKLTRSLSYQPDADSELSTLGKDLLKNIGRDYCRAGRSKT